MTNRTKLTEAMKKTDLSGFEQAFALILYEVNGLDDAMIYVNQKTIERRLGVGK